MENNIDYSKLYADLLNKIVSTAEAYLSDGDTHEYEVLMSVVQEEVDKFNSNGNE